MAVNIISRYNNLLNRIKKATNENITTLFDDVKSFYKDCNSLDGVYVKRILGMYVEKLQQLIDDNAVVYEKIFAKLNEAKNAQYDFSGEKDDSGAVQTMLLQIMGNLPRANNKANALQITTVINKALQSGVVGCKAILSLSQYPAYADMVNENQRAKAVDGSKSDAQKAFEHAMSITQKEYGKKCAEVFHQGARLRRLNKRTDNFMKAVRADEADTANESRPSFWGNDVSEVMQFQG